MESMTLHKIIWDKSTIFESNKAEKEWIPLFYGHYWKKVINSPIEQTEHIQRWQTSSCSLRSQQLSLGRCRPEKKNTKNLQQESGQSFENITFFHRVFMLYRFWNEFSAFNIFQHIINSDLFFRDLSCI